MNAKVVALNLFAYFFVGSKRHLGKLSLTHFRAINKTNEDSRKKADTKSEAKNEPFESTQSCFFCILGAQIIFSHTVHIFPTIYILPKIYSNFATIPDLEQLHITYKVESHII